MVSGPCLGNELQQKQTSGYAALAVERHNRQWDEVRKNIIAAPIPQPLGFGPPSPARPGEQPFSVSGAWRTVVLQERVLENGGSPAHPFGRTAFTYVEKMLACDSHVRLRPDRGPDDLRPVRGSPTGPATGARGPGTISYGPGARGHRPAPLTPAPGPAPGGETNSR